MRKNLVIYPGSFDPITDGHVDIIKRAVELFDKVIVAVLKNPNKKVTFTATERVNMIKESVAGLDKVEVESFDGLLIDYLKKKNAKAIIRGLRMISDFENEFQMALMNRKMSPDFETIFLMTSEEYSFLSSSLVKEIHSLGGDVKQFVPGNVVKMIKKKIPVKKKGK